MMRLLLSSTVVMALAIGGGYAYKAAADTSNPSDPSNPGAGGQPPGTWAFGDGQDGPGFPPSPDGGTGWGAGTGPGWGHHHDDFSLFAKVKNENLSTADVKVIATAILLEHGNHDWTVTNVTTQSDKSIDFSFVTAHGDAIATFSVDPASGHLTRIS